MEPGFAYRRCYNCNNDFLYEIRRSPRPPLYCSPLCKGRANSKRQKDRKATKTTTLPFLRSIEEMRRTGMTYDERIYLRTKRNEIQRPKELAYRKMVAQEKRRIPDRPFNPCIDEE